MGVFNFLKKKETVIDSYNTREVDGATIWMVSWDARNGEYSDDKKRAAKAFFNENDAVNFAQSLKDAQKLLQYKENICIRIEKQ